ncbi:MULTISPECIES: tRNA (N(6)-L-threonylcarbamoyladenosine(37)-C(2))-methylthiotransferase MtaB [unclassified Oceanispirochaeta]|uniref:tRNA (N(6)-L-threonylcarbamoyladenosine(37)-C(2))- methylthiotransferase MtaB n=1 Tax=unclassified Oceanispirochaeta TaxID=2635722 RepID=UPI000E09DF5F|nr:MULTISPECIES: tRNA (N(6)-L-threonylcarbamoyladenosine(37)-C(2))-methylthiotransferase MtaB [unclassified Oceanispirochaeta]MBF9015692.1 tRNA (N(6)-L-threonylcarbamoyladenosine(37)-C(2))-methylthiotransferase MtaB [Oceanispirochaeta sp. M2]NPD72157.1 tRNA (N(6)-L-threonylcarbamoyladenosine(37)-C(2))-methylthiotransferase MtaB [Oceanispirochaeta sp. M1]RDG32256.1 tRNA (N(6)-L-threonylcarbamoyladenosine(37)-C(2))-methylthiotransferase MtaB [Oceanispirochaeta sp. M1]
MKAAFFTFGCKLNQCETEALAEAFEKQGFDIVEFSDPADVYVVNTCTVTSKSEQKARRVIRKTSRDYPESLVIVTGCYAQLEPELIGELGDNVLSVALDRKDLIMDMAGFLGSGQSEGQELYRSAGFWLESQSPGIDESEGRFRFSAADFNFHARAFLKIQDGCDHRCAYCRVCLARGKSVSLSSDTLMERLKDLEAGGYEEVVLTGVNIDSYRDGSMNLSDLLHRIIEETDHFRIRLSSLEPKTLLERDLSILSHPRICSHFHVSAQSLSDSVLKRMNRPYGSQAVIDAVARLRELKDNPFIAADIIAGFPGETETEHNVTVTSLKQIDFARIHVFPFSARPDTAAWEMKPKIPERITGERTEEIRGISSKSYKNYLEQQTDRTAQVLLEEEKKSGEDKFWEGTSDNYLRVRIPYSDEMKRGTLVSCRIVSEKNGTLYGKSE